MYVAASGLGRWDGSASAETKDKLPKERDNFVGVRLLAGNRFINLNLSRIWEPGLLPRCGYFLAWRPDERNETLSEKPS